MCSILPICAGRKDIRLSTSARFLTRPEELNSWDLGHGEIGDFARNAILAEVVALANSDGGSLILGIDETNEKPPRAESIVAQKNVRELSTRFEDQARACIDPPISMLSAHPVETDGSNGVVILRVGPSRHAPHRLTPTRECYVRRGTSTVKMMMREIQAMVLNSGAATMTYVQNLKSTVVVFRNGEVAANRLDFARPLFRLTICPMRIVCIR